MDERYFSMRAQFFEREIERACTFKLQELEELWFCSRKNVKRILHQFEDRGKLMYLPGEGRGNSSRLLFSNDFQGEVEEVIKDCVQKGQLDATAHLLRLPIPKLWIMKASSDIREIFGYQSGNESKDILHGFIERDLTTLNPVNVSITFESHLIEYLGDTLVKYDVGEDRILPHLAHHFKVDDEQRRFTFYLRKGVLFHSHDKLTSRDVESTVSRIKDARGSASQWLADDIQEVECEGPYKVTIVLRNPNPFFLRYIASPHFSILPASMIFNEYEWIGSGPFAIKERTTSKLVLEAFDHYFLERPLLDELHFYGVTKEAASIVNYNLDDSQPDQVKSKQAIESGFRFLLCNGKRDSIIKEHSFRKALYHLVDINEMGNDLGWGEWVEASSFVPSRSCRQEKRSEKIYPLLKESGYSGEAIQLYHLDYGKGIQTAEWLKMRGAQFGILFELHPFSYKDFYESNIEQMADVVLIGEVSSLDSHLSFLGAFKNDFLYFRKMFPIDSIEWIDNELEKFKKEDWPGREAIMERIEEHIRHKNLLIFLYHPIKKRTFHPMIKDVTFHSFSHIDFSKLWIPH